jgi:hypothetical protein
MSDEGGVIPSDVVREITLQEVTPVAGKGALGTWQTLTAPGLWAGINCVIKYGPRSLSENSLLIKYFPSKNWLKQVYGKIF